MKTLIQGARLLNPADGSDQQADIAIAAGRIIAVGTVPADFVPQRTLDASGCYVLPGLVDLAVRLREPGQEHARMLESEMHAAVAGGVTSLVCPPDTEPVLDESGLVEMLRFRAARLRQARVFPLGALTRQLKGEVLTEMVELTESGCVGFSQADVTIRNTQVLQRALQYASTFGFTVWLRPEDAWLGGGVAASGALAQRMGLSGVPVLAETIAIMTIVEMMKVTGARVHLCRLSSAAAVELVRQAKAAGLPLSCDVSINSLHLTDVDMGYFDSRARLNPPLRQQGDRAALRAALADGTIDALVSDHNPIDEDHKVLPFAEAEPGATGVELLLALALKWAQEDGVPLLQAIATVTSRAAGVLGDSLGTLAASAGQIVAGGVADLCIWDPAAEWEVTPDELLSQGKYTPFEGMRLQGRVRATVVDGQIAFEASQRAAQPA
ncbi:dihydroorotase [Brachymonas denitrificans]|uniref:dihydroorotase n=2 Tax=Brachymonas denitrificans TaxID=28220 RepID=UPI001BCB88FC|nr:dihydroorotase [Brachymonas denitrificans]